MRPPAQRRSRRLARDSDRGSHAVEDTGDLRVDSGSGQLRNNSVRLRSSKTRLQAQHSQSNTPASQSTAAAAGPRLTRSKATEADLAPPLEGSGSSRRSLYRGSKAGSGVGLGGSSSSNSSKKVTCSICFDDVSLDEMHRMGACRHSFCRSCLASYYTSALKSKDLPANCPSPGCKRGVSVRDATLIFAGKAKVATSFIQANKDATAISRGAAIYCPNSHCSKVVHIRKLTAAATRKLTWSQRQKAQQAVHKSSCSHCGKNCCTSCRGPWHAGVSCAEYQALPAAEKGEAEMALWELSEDKQWKRCPSCRSMVERTEGCNYMMCRCKQPFCYRCGDKIEICYSTGCLSGRPWI